VCPRRRSIMKCFRFSVCVSFLVLLGACSSSPATTGDQTLDDVGGSDIKIQVGDSKGEIGFNTDVKTGTDAQSDVPEELDAVGSDDAVEEVIAVDILGE